MLLVTKVKPEAQLLKFTHNSQTCTETESELDCYTK